MQLVKLFVHCLTLICSNRMAGKQQKISMGLESGPKWAVDQAQKNKGMEMSV